MAVETAGHRLAPPYEAWIGADPSRSSARVLITGPQGSERAVAFALDQTSRDDHGTGRLRLQPRPPVRPSASYAPPRRRMAAAAPPVPAQAAGKKRRLSPEGRARIIAATKRRWAALRKAKAKTAAKSAVRKRATAENGCEDHVQLGPEARCPEKRRQEFKVGGRARSE